ncbi:putative death-receptor fusion protein-domain-containing protein [Dichotomocladium elegans]|nr:putative death-receptor fusion protein-domain-containing protein [Dichotomocladium elegans]
MSRSEKTKAGAKPIKLPAPLFQEWQAILDSSGAAADQDVPIINALRKLAKSANDAWERQAQYLKEASKAIGRLDEGDRTLVREVVEPIVSSGYLACDENLARRHFIPLVEACSKHSDNATFVRLYEGYISIDAPCGHSFAQRALTVMATLDFNYGRRVVLDSYHATLDFLTHALTRLETQLAGFVIKGDDNSSTHVSLRIGTNNTLAVADMMNDIQYLTKAIHTLLSRYPQHAQKLFSSVDDGTDIPLFSQLFKVLFNMCAETDVYIKDCSQVAGMAIAAIINLIQDVSFARQLVLGWFFASNSEPVEASRRVGEVLGVAPKRSLVGERGWKDRSVPMLSVVRGLVSCLRYEILLSPCPPELVLVEYLPKGLAPINLQEILFFSIDWFCSRPDLEAPSRVIAFESMATWLLACKSMIRSSDGDKRIMASVSAAMKPENTDRLVHYVWDHWDDPIDAIQHKVRAIFEAALEVLELKASFFSEQELHQQFLIRLLNNLMQMDAHRKVKYALLSIVVPKLGTNAFFKADPDFIWKCIRSMDSLVLSPQITAVILGLLYQRIEETIPGVKFKGQNTKLVEKESTQAAILNWIEIWATPVLRCLTSPSEVLRKNVSNFILPPLFNICGRAFWYLMERLQLDQKNQLWSNIDREFRLHAIIAVLKVGRSLDIVDGNAYTLDELPPSARKISVDTLKQAIYHGDQQVRLDVLGLLCESRKAISPVTKIEMDILRQFIPLNMNCTSPEFRQMFCTHLSKLFLRLRGNLYAQFRTYRSCLSYVENKAGVDSRKEMMAKAEAEEAACRIEEAKEFLFWLLEHIGASLYPGSSYQRVATALRLLNILVKTFGVNELPTPEGFATQPEFPFLLPIGTPAMTKILIDTLMNPYDFNRAQALEILNNFPNPLPGIESRQDAQHLLWWGLDNVMSTRAGESDSGAMIFRLIFTKYVKELGYDLYPERDNRALNERPSSMAPVVFTGRLLDHLAKQVEAAKSNLLIAAQQHPMHGTLLALQYVFRELDYNNSAVAANLSEWKKVHQRALKMVHAVCDSVMDVLSNPSPEGNVPASFREMEEAIDDLIDDGDDADEESTGPKHQVILSCCWRAVKEASSLLEVIMSRAPVSNDKTGIITSSDMVDSGVLLRSLLTTIRHRGAFSAVYPAYVSLNTRMLTSGDQTITDLPATWLDENLNSLTASNISITRRSAGLPLCILAILSSERSTKKILLDKAMKRLFSLAFQEPPADADQRIDLPQVHAYNILRTIFMDAKLASNVLIYAADGFSLAINGFSSSSWAIRNCAVMLFSTLLQRTFGTKKTKDEHSNVNKLTGREFFTRYPQLHPYLLKELGAAVQQLLTQTAGASVHPGLFPILTLLSRLHPSVMDGSDQVTAMAAFVPLVMTCAVSSIFKTREMAARALVPLITSADLVQTILNLLDIPEAIGQNEIHGRLLQTQFLLRGHAYHPLLKDVLVSLLKHVPQAFQRLLVRQGTMSRMTYALLLDICSEFFFDCAWIRADRDPTFTQELEVVAQTELTPLRTVVIDTCLSEIKVPRKEAIVYGNYLARESMAKIIVWTALRGYRSSVKVVDIMFLLDDPDYEVRLTSMELLKKHMKTTDDGADALRERLMIKTYHGEDNLYCFVSAAQFLLSFESSELFRKKLPFTRVQYWTSLAERFQNSRSQSVAEAVLPLLGSVLAETLDEQVEDTEWTKAVIATWSRFVVTNSHKEITLPLREAAVGSIRFMAKHIFKYDQEPAMLHVQHMITQLLQDDDIDIRHTTATIVSDALLLPTPVHPERATELVYSHLGNVKYNLRMIQTLLQGHLQGEHDLRSNCNEELSVVKALFAKENPNIYKEDIIDVQWLFVNLDRLSLKNTGFAVADKDFIQKTFDDMQYILTLIKRYSTELMTHGPFGITSRPTIFLGAYRTLLAATLVLDMVNCSLSTDSFVSVVQDLDTAIRGVMVSTIHPLLWQLIHGDNGVKAKISQFLRRNGRPQYSSMFLLAPDSQEQKN